MQEIFKNNKKLILSILKNLNIYLKKQIKADNIKELKDVEFYSNLVNAFINNSLELDKTFLNLSAGAIGILVTFGQNLQIKTFWEKLLYILSLVVFLLTIMLIIMIFNYNKKYLEAITENKEDITEIEARLGCLDIIARISFFLGILLASILGIKLLLK